MFLLGDTHGDYEKVHAASQIVGKEKLIILVDFGFVFNKALDGDKLQRLSKLPTTILFVDGNHCNFPALEKFPKIKKYGGIVSKLAKNVFWLRRGQIYKIDGHKCLTIGGAYSVDKRHRIPDVSWWHEENLSHDEMEKVLDVIDNFPKVDYVFTHTCPTSIITKMDMGFSGKVNDTNANFFETIWADKLLDFKHWYFGHFHVDVSVDDKFTCVSDKLVKIGPKVKVTLGHK